MNAGRGDILSDDRAPELNSPRVVYIMGAARSGSTLLGTLIGQAPDVFFAGELCDWPGRDGRTTVPHGVDFWSRVRTRVGAPPAGSKRLKTVVEHPAGLLTPVSRFRLMPRYELITRKVLSAVATTSGCGTVVDSSHYPRRVNQLRRILGPGAVRLVYMVRRPSAIARSLRSTRDKSELKIQIYLLVVGILAWCVYLTHPRRERVLISYEKLTIDPLSVAARASGRPLEDVDPERLTPPLVFIGNRFVKNTSPITVRPHEASTPDLRDRLTDLLQLPLFLAWRRGRKSS